MTPTAARRTSRRSPPASTAQASFDAPPARSTGSETGPSTASSASRISVRSSLSMATVVIPDLVADRRERVRGFMQEHVYPNEATLGGEDEAADALIRELQHEAKEAGLWA